MRNNEEFKDLVNEKHNALLAKRTANRRRIITAVSCFLVCVVVAGTFFGKGITFNNGGDVSQNIIFDIEEDNGKDSLHADIINSNSEKVESDSKSEASPPEYSDTSNYTDAEVSQGEPSDIIVSEPNEDPIVSDITSGEPNEDTTVSDITSDTPIATPDEDPIESDVADNAPSDIVQLSIFDYDEYVQFTKNTALPDYFVSYEDLSEFGEFTGFVCLSDATKDDYSSLFYTFEDETGAEVSMYVNYPPEKWYTESSKSFTILEKENINPADMRTATVNETKCRYIYNDIEYHYSFHGYIMSINWRCGELEYILSSIHNYPATDKATAVNKLMNLDSADDVVKTMKSYGEVPNE